MTETTLFYVADPMCSWCYGFEETWERIQGELASDVRVRYVLGGLAPDSDEPMPAATRDYVRSAWDAVEAATGATFNRDFWTSCEPRRSTWPSCRAVLAAAAQDPAAGPRMFRAIQRAYYREARNPSDAETLVSLARELELDADAFSHALNAPETQRRLEEDFVLRDRLGARGFPSLVFERGTSMGTITRGYAPYEQLVPPLRAAEVLG